MTTPNLQDLVPSKAKAYVGLIGSLLSVVIPYVLAVSDSLPDPWPLLIGAVVAVLTALGVYKAPYKPTGTVLAPVDTSATLQVQTTVDTTDSSAPPVSPPAPDPGKKYRNPYRR